MKEKFKLLFISYIVILLCTVLIIGGTFSLFTDSVTVKNHLQAGTLNVELVRTNLKYTKINEDGYFDVIENNKRLNFTKPLKNNIFGIEDESLMIIPGSYFDTTMELINNGNVPFEYSVMIIINQEINSLFEQLEVEIVDSESNIFKKKLSDFVDGNSFMIGEMNSIENKENFKIKISFLNDVNNNLAMSLAVEFDLIVSATQKIKEE